MINVTLPYHLRTLCRVKGEISLECENLPTLRTVLDALEAKYPVLRGTIRDHAKSQRRPFVRFYACTEDWSHESHDKELPAAIADGREPLLIVGAMAGG